jgi:hypothetical protein
VVHSVVGEALEPGWPNTIIIGFRVPQAPAHRGHSSANPDMVMASESFLSSRGPSTSSAAGCGEGRATAEGRGERDRVERYSLRYHHRPMRPLTVVVAAPAVSQAMIPGAPPPGGMPQGGFPPGQPQPGMQGPPGMQPPYNMPRPGMHPVRSSLRARHTHGARCPPRGPRAA